MADKDNIDKALPNVDPEVVLPKEEIVVTEEDKLAEVTPDGAEVIMDEEGGAEVNFDPMADQQVTQNHFENIAELLEQNVLGRIGSDLNENYMQYKTSRKDWEDTYIKGLDLLGFKYVQRSQPFQGASGATHPVLAEAVTQFQATAYKELLPASGPVRTQILGAPTRDKEDQSQRVKDYMNYQIMNEMPEYEAEFDQMLFYLPLAGSAFKKVYYDDIKQRAVSKFVPADDLVVPYTATSLDDCESLIHMVRMTENDLRKQQVGGFYRDLELNPSYIQETDAQKKERELEGATKGRDDRMFTIFECHVNLDLEGFEDQGQDGQPTGIKLPYIVTLEDGTRKVLSIRRNYEMNDPKKDKIEYFVHFKFLPGLGFYGFGLIHMIGGLSRTATAALRQLLDAGTLSNLPAGFKMRGIKMRDEAQAIQPGEFRDVDAPGGNLRDAFMTLPFKEPSQTLLQLMGVVVSAGQRFASIADLQVGDGNQQAAVGTTVAMLERGSRVMSAIHKRLYAAMRQEFTLLARVFKLYLPPVYPYDVVGGQKQIMKMDFDDRVDILPVADPNIFSQTQRISLAQTELQLAASNPKMHNQYEVYRNMYEALGVKDIDLILKPKPKMIPKDPALEHIDALAAQPFRAYPGQDHQAHITAHLNFIATNMVRNNPMVMGAIEKNCLEHISLMAQEQIELEFREEMQQLQQQQMMVQQLAQQNPQAAQQAQMQMQQMQQKIDARKAVLIAEMMEDFMKEEKKITSQFDHDPIAKLRSRELDIRAMDNEAKRKAAQEKLNMDNMKVMMNQDIQETKIDQNEELAELRADTSIEKQEMANENRIKIAKMRPKGNGKSR